MTNDSEEKHSSVPHANHKLGLLLTPLGTRHVIKTRERSCSRNLTLGARLSTATTQRDEESFVWFRVNGRSRSFGAHPQKHSSLSLPHSSASRRERCGEWRVVRRAVPLLLVLPLRSDKTHAFSFRIRILVALFHLPLFVRLVFSISLATSRSGFCYCFPHYESSFFQHYRVPEFVC